MECQLPSGFSSQSQERQVNTGGSCGLSAVDVERTSSRRGKKVALSNNNNSDGDDKDKSEIISHLKINISELITLISKTQNTFFKRERQN